MPYSACRDFVTRDTELIGAWRIFQTQKKANNVSVYQHYVDCCAKFGIDIIPALDRMIVVDYIIANEDRHLNNFGLIREAESLKWIDFEQLKDVGELIRSVFDDERAVQFIDEKRVDSMVTSTEKRIRMLREYAEEFDGKPIVKSTEDDVKKNIAEDYLN